MSILDQLENEGRRSIARRAREVSRPSYVKAGLVAFVASPFLLTAGILIPLAGQLLFALAAGLTVIFLWLKRSILLFLSGVIGAAFGIGLLAFGASIWKESGAPFFYLLAAFCTVISIVYVMVIASGIYLHFEKGAEQNRL